MSAENKIYPYKDIKSKEDLSIGTLLDIGSIDHVDDFAIHMSKVIDGSDFCTFALLTRGDQASPGLPLLSILIKERARKLGFNGGMGGSKALVLPPDTVTISRWYKGSFYFKREAMATFLIATDMHTTGRAEPVGVVTNVLSMYHPVTQGGNEGDGEMWAVMKATKSKETMAAISDLINQSYDRYATSLREGLAHIYPAGLPTLGKRR